MSQILVTGGCGYIGSHIVRLLSSEGEKIVVYDNLSQGSKSSLLSGEELIVGDIRDSIALDKVFSNHDISVVIHLAALVDAGESVSKPDLYRDVNDYGSKKVWEASIKAGVKSILYASSAAVYGIPGSSKPISESDQLNPTNPYGETKLAGELSLRDISRNSANYLSYRFFNVGGAENSGRLGQSKSSNAIMQRLFAVASGDEISITINGNDYNTSDGTVVRDFVHVEDIANAFLLGIKYLRNNRESTTINLGSGVNHTIGEVIKEVEVVTGKPIPVVFGQRKSGDISYSLSNIMLAKQVLGWVPKNNLTNIIDDGWNSYLNKASI